MAKISVVISAFNEEEKIEACLLSVKDFASEIIFVDNSSTDKTALIARKFTKNIFKRENSPMLNVNKNFGFTKATGNWILSLDADERVTPELKDEIKSTIEQLNNGTINGYFIPRKNIIFGKWIRHTGWYPDYQLRLIRKDKGKFPEEHVHEMIKAVGEVTYLKNNLLHEHYGSIQQFLLKMTTIYVPNEAAQRIKNGYKFVWQDVFRMPLQEFMSRFFAREGYKDGMHGVVLSTLMAFYHLAIVATIWEKEKYRDDTSENLLDNVLSEFTKGKQEVAYWVASKKIEETKNIFTKVFYRLKRKSDV